MFRKVVVLMMMVVICFSVVGCGSDVPDGLGSDFYKNCKKVIEATDNYLKNPDAFGAALGTYTDIKIIRDEMYHLKGDCKDQELAEACLSSVTTLYVIFDGLSSSYEQELALIGFRSSIDKARSNLLGLINGTIDPSDVK
jgi:hypothetical protein